MQSSTYAKQIAVYFNKCQRDGNRLNNRHYVNISRCAREAKPLCKLHQSIPRHKRELLDLGSGILGQILENYEISPHKICEGIAF